MMKPPAWATKLLNKIARDEGREDIPILEWRFEGSFGAAGGYYQFENRIRVKTAGDQISQRLYGRMTLVHEIAHWLVDGRRHSAIFWDKVWELYHRYDVCLSLAKRHEGWYRKGSVTAYARYMRGEKYEEWRPKGDPKRLGDCIVGDYVILKPLEQGHSWYYGTVGDGGIGYRLFHAYGKSWNLPSDWEVWPAKRRASKEAVS